MATIRHVFLDPDDTLPEYLGVILEFPTGARYQHQCGGTDCALREVEGYYVPLGGLQFAPEAGLLDARDLRTVFHRGDDCVWGGQPWRLPPNTPLLPPDRLSRLRGLVEAIPYWVCGEADNQREHLRLDGTRLGELLEAWAPVLTPDGPGVLVWKNCD